MLSAMLAETASLLGPDLSRVRIWSVTIDPDFDTPEVLRAYAANFEAPPEWRFLTGHRREIARMRDAFGALADNKMAHRALVMLRLDGDRWARFEGPTLPETLAAEVRAVLPGA